MSTPVLTVKNQTVNEGKTIAASSLISSVSDPGKSITYYAFWDFGQDSSYLALNGVKQSTGKWIVVAANQLSSLQFVGGTSTGNDQVAVEAYDGSNWSQYQDATITTTFSPSTAATNPTSKTGTYGALNTSPGSTWLYGNSGTPQITAVNQGQYGDCWMLSSIMALDAMNPNAIKNMISYDGNGVYTVNLFSGGAQKSVLVNDQLLSSANNGNYYSNSSSNPNGNWASLIEKAYASLNGNSYDSAYPNSGGYGSTALTALTGKSSSSYSSINTSVLNTMKTDMTGSNSSKYEIVLSSGDLFIPKSQPSGAPHVNGSALYTGTNVLEGLAVSFTNLGSSGSHAYAVIGYDSATSDFVVANPWGGGSKSPYSGSSINTSYSSDVITSTSTSYGVNYFSTFEMSAADVQSFCNAAYICGSGTGTTQAAALPTTGIAPSSAAPTFNAIQYGESLSYRDSVGLRSMASEASLSSASLKAPHQGWLALAS